MKVMMFVIQKYLQRGRYTLYDVNRWDNITKSNNGVLFIDPRIEFDGTEKEWREYVLNE